MFTCNQTGDCMEAISALKLVEVEEVVIKDELQAALAYANRVNTTLNNSALASEITTAQGVYNNASATQTDVDNAKISLNSTVVTALTGADREDLTFVIDNPGFENCDVTNTNAAAGESAAPLEIAGNWTQTASAPWSSSAVVTYGGSGQVNGASAPTTDNAGNNGNTLGISVGWNGSVIYQSSTILLPAGDYTLKVNGYNANTATQFTSLFGFIPTTGGQTLSTKKSYASNSWETDEVIFTLTETTEGIIQVGGTAISGGSGSNAKVFFDNITLSYVNPLAAARAALSEEIEKAKACDEKEGLANAIAAAEEALADATTEEELAAALAALQAADKDALLRKDNNLTDASVTNGLTTSFVVNGSFDNDVNGWTSNGGFQNGGLATNQQGDFTGSFWENWDPSAKVNKMYQTINNVPNGTYKLKIAAFVNTLADPNESQFVFANDDKTYLTTGNPTFYEVWTVVTNNTVQVGLEQTTATANWMGIDNVSLTYYGAGDVITEAQMGSHKTNWDEALAAAQATVADEAYDNVAGKERADLNAEITKAEPTTAEGYDEATIALRSATAYFISAKTNYDIFAAYNKELSYADANKKPVISNETTAASIITSLRAYYESHALAEGVEGAVNMTGMIANATNPTNNESWTWNGSKNNPASNEPWTDANGTNTHSYFDGGNWGANSWTTTMEQNVTLAPGKYLLTAKARASENVTFTLSVGDASVELPHIGNTGNVFDRGWGDVSLEFESDGITASNILVSASTENHEHEWFSISDFRLVQIEARALSDEIINDLIENIPEGKMNAGVQQTLNQAKETLQTDKSIESYNALIAAITAANNSIAAYTAANEKLTAMRAIVESTNVYAAEAEDTYYTQWAEKYEDNSLTDEEANALVNPNATTGWRAESPEVSKFLISAWDAEPNDWDGLHVNTWSAAGDFGETGFAVPLTEYWVGNGSLPAKTMTATVSGLEAGNYKVSADMFVKASTTPTGVSLQVGDASEASITGTQNGDFFVSEATAFGTVGEDGNLVIKLIVAEGNNTNWIGFKNMKYEKVNVDYAALNAAIATANAVNATIDGGVKALTDAIAEAQELLTSADQNAIDEAANTLAGTTEAAKAIIAARKNLAGVAKKAGALKGYLENDITEDIAAATEYAANAEATAEEADTKADALNANFEEWEVVPLNNGTFDTGLNGELIEPGTEAKPYVHAVDGWTQNFKFTSTASQGIAAAYGSAAQNGTNGTAAPIADMFGKSEGGTLHLSSGWSDQARYYQVVENLPAGKYVFYYEGINANNTTNALDSNYFGIGNLTAGDIEGTNDSFKFSDEKNFTYNEWKAVAFDFTLTKTIANANINVGLVGGTGGSGSTPKMWFDNVTIYCISTTEMADEADYTALAKAIAAAEGKTLGFDADEYAPYKNVAAIEALAAAKAIDSSVENSKIVVEEATATLTDAVWTANTEEMNCIYDGQFAKTEANTTSGDINLPGWTKVQGIRLLVKDEATDPGLAYTDGKAALFSWGGTTLSYGDQTGYTLPMNADETYELTFKVAGWRDGELPTYVKVSLDGAEQSKDVTVKAINTADENPFASVKFYVKPTAENSVLTIYAEKHFAIADLMLVHATAIPGDVNRDMKVDIADITALVNAINNNESPKDGKIDGDDDVDADDVRALVEMILAE